MADVWEQYFQIADADRDGKISGGEAVAFFQKSGLPQMTLAKVRADVYSTHPFDVQAGGKATKEGQYCLGVLRMLD